MGGEECRAAVDARRREQRRRVLVPLRRRQQRPVHRRDDAGLRTRRTERTRQRRAVEPVRADHVVDEGAHVAAPGESRRVGLPALARLSRLAGLAGGGGVRARCAGRVDGGAGGRSPAASGRRGLGCHHGRWLRCRGRRCRRHRRRAHRQQRKERQRAARRQGPAGTRGEAEGERGGTKRFHRARMLSSPRPATIRARADFPAARCSARCPPPPRNVAPSVAPLSAVPPDAVRARSGDRARRRFLEPRHRGALRARPPGAAVGAGRSGRGDGTRGSPTASASPPASTRTPSTSTDWPRSASATSNAAPSRRARSPAIRSRACSGSSKPRR